MDFHPTKKWHGIIAPTLLSLGLIGRAQAQPPPPSVALSPVVISATRSSAALDELPVTVDLFSSERLRNTPAGTLDAALRESAAFSLFRRSSSLLANPTAQGVSLRGLGPSGASRSLVLFDGVPLNDPFGGWVGWSKVPRLALAGAEIVRGGGSGAWGNAALGGTVALFSTPPETNKSLLAASLGQFGTRQGEISLTRSAGRGAIRIDAEAFATDGVFAISPSQRGSIDRRLDSTNQMAQVTWKRPLGSGATSTVTVRGFSEERGNGTPLQRNSTREAFVSLALASDPGRPRGKATWSLSAYAQRQRFESFFSSVDAVRQSETPANDQFAVPASAAGAAVTAQWAHAEKAATVVGGDVRWVEGETREDFSLVAGRFTRRRFAGGEQLFAGIFVTHDRPLFGTWHGSSALRVDRWSNTDGHRREFDLSSGAPTRNDSFASETGVELSPRLGFTGPLANGLRGRAAAYRAFRVPTLNEYYRPFRVGNVSTEANATLRRETMNGGELGIDFDRRAFHLALSGFTNSLSDAVANVTLSRTPTLTTRQRRNLDTIRVRGFEATLQWSPLASLILRADLLYNDARVRSAAEQPALAGTRLAQVPRTTATAGAVWKHPSGWNLDARVRSLDTQFEDDENTLRLAAAVVFDAQVARRFTPSVDGFVAIENATDRAVETGRSVEGIVTYDAPRRIRAGVRASW